METGFPPPPDFDEVMPHLPPAVVVSEKTKIKTERSVLRINVIYYIIRLKKNHITSIDAEKNI